MHRRGSRHSTGTHEGLGDEDFIPRANWFARYSILFAVCLALLALVGWVTGSPSLSSFGNARVPMAPTTIALFLLLGVAALVRLGLPRNSTLRWMSNAVALVTVLAALFLFISAMLGLHWHAERLGLPVGSAVSEISLKHMSPLTAFCLAVLGMAFLLLPARRGEGALARYRGTLAAASVVGLTSFVLLLAYLLGSPVLYGSMIIPPALSTALGLVGLSAGFAAMSWTGMGQPPGMSKREYPTASLPLVLLFVALAVGIGTTGYLYYRSHETNYRSEVERQLAAIADLKVDELVQWRRERLGDAALFHGNAAFTAEVQRALGSPADLASRQNVEEWMAHVEAVYGYDRVFLLVPKDSGWTTVFGSAEPIASDLARDAAWVLESGDVAFFDLHRDTPDGPIYMGLLIPLLTPPPDESPLGVLVLLINPETYLYGVVQRWPTPSPTAETLLVRREGDEVLFLNELLFQKGSALAWRRPLTEETLPAVMAVLGKEGVVEGVDYRGVPVLAAVRSVPDSPWALVARIDMDEIYQPLRGQLVVVVALIGGLLLSAGTGVGLLWRRQRVRYYRDRLRTSEKLLESESRYRHILDSMMEGYQILGFDYRYLYANDAAAEHGCRAKEDLLGQTMMEMYPGIETTPLFETLRRCMEERVAEVMENEFSYPDGSSAWFSLTMQPVEQGVAVLSLDITKRKQAERDLRALNVELVRRVEERTAQLQAANEELEAFAYSVSHDLRGPLRGMDGFSQALLEDYADQLDERGKDYLKRVRRAAERMGLLIEDLLKLSRVTRQEMKQETVNLSILAHGIVTTLEAEDPDRKIKFAIQDDLVTKGDLSLIRLALENLLHNAWKFTSREAQATIEVGEMQSDEEAVYFVRDNGVGFDMAYVGKLFGAFQRLHATKEFPGTGIGLATVQRIIHRHGGRIWAEGDVDRGATFFFTMGQRGREE